MDVEGAPFFFFFHLFDVAVARDTDLGLTDGFSLFEVHLGGEGSG